MAEFMMKDMVRRAGREADFYIASAATSREEIGNDCLLYTSHHVQLDSKLFLRKTL